MTLAEQIELVRKRKFPVVGDGGGVWSFIHVADAADATVAAIERGSRGVYNVVDDDPAPVAEWLPALAEEKVLAARRWAGRQQLILLRQRELANLLRFGDGINN